jgi:hypothetical protein
VDQVQSLAGAHTRLPVRYAPMILRAVINDFYMKEASHLNFKDIFLILMHRLSI